eukprot:6465618-Amphidinium_carterae.1
MNECPVARKPPPPPLPSKGKVVHPVAPKVVPPPYAFAFEGKFKRVPAPPQKTDFDHGSFVMCVGCAWCVALLNCLCVCGLGTSGIGSLACPCCALETHVYMLVWICHGHVGGVLSGCDLCGLCCSYIKGDIGSGGSDTDCVMTMLWCCAQTPSNEKGTGCVMRWCFARVCVCLRGRDLACCVSAYGHAGVLVSVGHGQCTWIYNGFTCRGKRWDSSAIVAQMVGRAADDDEYSSSYSYYSSYSSVSKMRDDEEPDFSEGVEECGGDEAP